MSILRENDDIIVRYLLGQLSESEQEGFERRYFNEDAFYERLEIVEDDLVDAYVSGRLSGSQLERFEKYYLCHPDRQEKVAFAREWKDLVAGSSAVSIPSKRPPSWLDLFRNRLVLIPLAGTLLLAIGSAWLGFQLTKLNTELERLRSERAGLERTEQELLQQVAEERLRNEQLLQDLENERSRRDIKDQSPSIPIPIMASFILTPGLSRDAGEAHRFTIPSEATEVRLQALFQAADYKSYHAELQTVGGRVVWSRRNLKAVSRGSNLVAAVTVPARMLSNEDYILVLRGVTDAGTTSDVAEYSFRIVK